MKRHLNHILILILLVTAQLACARSTSIPTEIPAFDATITELPSATEQPAATDVPETAIPAPTEAPSDGELARQYLDLITAGGPREVGSEENAAARDMLVNLVTEMGYEPILQEFANEAGQSAANIIWTREGQSSEQLIVGAHFDSVSAGDGYDDNGSGVAVVLEAARRVAEIETPFTLRFILFDSEESGLEGSFTYVSEMSQAEIDNTIAMVNLDSLAAGNTAYVYGDEGADGVLRDWVLEYAAENGLPLITQTGDDPELPPGTTGPWSDHAPFNDVGIQYVYFEATDWTQGELDGYTQVDPSYGVDGEVWHTRYDNAAYIDQQFPGRIDEHLSLFSRLLVHLLTEYK